MLVLISGKWRGKLYIIYMLTYSGSIFDNIFVGDDKAELDAFVAASWGKTHAAEKKAFDKIKEEERAREEADRKKREEEMKKLDEDEEEEEDHKHEDL